MPGGDRTGPLGMGPMTGRGVGYCAGYPVPGYANPFIRRGMGMARGRGFGRGFNRWYSRPAPAAYYPHFWETPYAQPYTGYAGYSGPGMLAVDQEVELGSLKEQSEYLTETLDSIKKRIEELESRESEKENK